MDMLFDADPDKMLHKELTDDIIKSFYKVYGKLGFGFPEQVYQNSMYIELSKTHSVVAQYPIDVYYEDHIVGKFKADLLVDNLVILELKAVSELCEAHAVQLMNYLKGTKIEVGLLLNFGAQPQIRRRLYENRYK